MIIPLLEELDRNTEKILGEFSRERRSNTAHRIVTSHGYEPKNRLFMIGNIRPASYVLYVEFLNATAEGPVPKGYTGYTLEIETDGGNYLELCVVAKKTPVAIIDQERHFGLLPHTPNKSDAEELAAYYKIFPRITEIPDVFKEALDGIDFSGI
jgi:hypothetical protein